MDTEDELENAGAVAEAAEADGFPVTYLVVARLAREHPELARRLVREGEVGSRADGHAPLAPLSRARQRDRLRTAVGLTEAAVGTRPVGFLPPSEAYAEGTQALLAGLGFEYQLGEALLDRAVPRVEELGPGPRAFVTVPRTTPDDDFEVRGGNEVPTRLAEAMLVPIARSRRVGGLHHVSLHTRTFGAPARVEVCAAWPASFGPRGRGSPRAGSWPAGPVPPTKSTWPSRRAAPIGCAFASPTAEARRFTASPSA